MLDPNFDPYADLLRMQSDLIQLNQELITLQKQLHQSLLTQQNIIQTVNHQARAILDLQNAVNRLSSQQ